MESASQQVSESASQPDELVHEGALGFISAEDGPESAAIADLDRRIRQLEAAIAEVRTMKASAATGGRKTSPAVMAGAAGVDDALGSLSLEQRIAVKSGLMRAGLL